MQDKQDILKEIGVIAAGHGSIALSDFLGRELRLQVPAVDIVPVSEYSQRIGVGKLEITIFSRMFGSLGGKILLIVDDESAFKLVELGYSSLPEEKGIRSIMAMGLSILGELGNIIVSSYTTVLTTMFHEKIMATFPTVITGSIDNILYLALAPDEEEDYACLIETVFEEPRHKIKGFFSLLLPPSSVKRLEEMCEQLLGERKEKQ